MKAVVLSDNLGCGLNPGEWGLSLFLQCGPTKVLLDTGASGLFAENADRLGIPLAEVEYAVLSHAHYDHADGMRVFFQRNDHARFYLQKSCAENCYRVKPEGLKYIGIAKGTLEEWSSRICYVEGDVPLAEGIWLVAHRTPGLEQAGLREKMYRKWRDRWAPDDFSHEQSLVCETEQGLVIFNSCCHGGADVVIREVAEAFPQQNICALVGGFHLFNKEDDFVRALASRIRETGIRRVCTGHCTGEHGFEVLKEELGDTVEQLRVGLVLDFP